MMTKIPSKKINYQCRSPMEGRREEEDFDASRFSRGPDQKWSRPSEGSFMPPMSDGATGTHNMRGAEGAFNPNIPTKTGRK